MKVALVCPTYTPYVGGVVTHVRMIAERLARLSVDLEVLTTDSFRTLPKEENINGVRVKRFNSWAPSESYYFSVSLWKYLNERSEDYDVVHAHAYHDFPALLAALSKEKNKLVFTPHYHAVGHTPFRQLLHVPYKPVGKTIFRRAETIICVSKYESRLVTSNFRVADSRLTVIPNGIVMSDFQGLEISKKKARTILYVGHLEEYKRVDILIRSLKYLDQEFSLEIVGNGGIKNRLLRVVKELSLDERVRFYDYLPQRELIQKYADAGVYALISRFEAFGISVAEALAAGTPCVVANSTALSEWVDGKNCLGIDSPDSPREVAKVILKAVGKPINLPEGKLKDWDDVATAVLKVYERL